MPDLFQLIAAWKKQILLTVLFSMIVATAIVFILPPKYLASSTAIPANPVTADRSIIFNNNIRDLYNSLGSASDLDMIVGTAQLDTIYIAVAKKLRLNSYYSVDDTSSIGLLKTARKLKKDTKVIKSEFGELQLRVWCKDKQLAPQLANALMDELGSIHQRLLNANNEAILANIDLQLTGLLSDIEGLQTKTDAGTANALTIQQIQTTQAQIAAYEKLKEEYRLMAKARPPALHIVEKARVSDRPDSPKKILILVAAAVVSFLFALWLAVLLDKRKNSGG